MTGESLLEMEWELPPGVKAACTTRLGGVSHPPWDSFNLATHVGDDASLVAVNRARLQEQAGLAADPAWLNQVHGIEVADLDAIAPGATPITADAAVASRAGVACVVMVADCLPVLFTARDGSRVGAAHAGWRGLAAGVLEKTMAAMNVPASELRVWLGPAISVAHFEVGGEVREQFVKTDGGAASYFHPNPEGRWQADLVGLATRRLASAGVDDIAGGKWCTYADRRLFFSHRRDGKAGRIAALISRV